MIEKDRQPKTRITMRHEMMGNSKKTHEYKNERKIQRVMIGFPIMNKK